MSFPVSKATFWGLVRGERQWSAGEVAALATAWGVEDYLDDPTPPKTPTGGHARAVLHSDAWREAATVPPVGTTVSLDRLGRWRWRVQASTVPAGGTRVDVWVRWGRGRAERKAARISEVRNRPPRYADDSRTLAP